MIETMTATVKSTVTETTEMTEMTEMIEMIEMIEMTEVIEEKEDPTTLITMTMNHGLTKLFTSQEMLEIKLPSTFLMILLIKLSTMLMKLKKEYQSIFLRMLVKRQNTMPNKQGIM